MVMDYLIVVYLTIVSVWPVTLPFIALIAWLSWRTGWKVTGGVFAALFVLVAIAAWQLERYL